MKQIILILSFTVFNFSFGQNKTKTVTKVDNGVKEITPSIVVEKKDEKTTQIFEVNNGVKEISPSKEIKKTDDGKIEIYNVTNNVREITPTVIIED
jgi:hypothetical protein